MYWSLLGHKARGNLQFSGEAEKDRASKDVCFRSVTVRPI